MNTPIGIDFGTSKTLVTWINPDNGHPAAIRLGRGRDEIPTTVFLCEDGTLLFGDDADDNAQFDFSSYARGFKLSLGSKTPQLIGAGKSYSGRQLTRAFLKHIKERCEKEAVMEKVTSAVITVPAIFSPAQRDDLLGAAKGAGFTDVELLSEPIAAGMAFCGLSPRDAFEGSILVVDWGGGTLDLAIVSRGKDGRFETAQGLVDGSSGIGGESLDEEMWKLVAELLAESGGIDLASEPVERRGVQLTAIRQAKEMLSTREEHRIALLTAQGPKGVVVSRSRFNSAIMSRVEQGAAKAFAVIDAARQKNHTPLFVLLVGGTCKVPLVHQAIESSTKMDCRVWQYSREAVAFGAALCAAKTKWSRSQTLSELPRSESDNYWVSINGNVDPTPIPRADLVDYTYVEEALFCRQGETDWRTASDIGLVVKAWPPEKTQCCKVYVQPAALGRIIGAAEVREPLETEDQLNAFITNHIMQCFVDLVVENKTPAPLRCPRLTFTNSEAVPNPHFLQMDDIPAGESGSYSSLNLNWVITPGDEIHVEFANMPGVKASVQVTPSDFATTWAEDEKSPQPLPVFVTWRRGMFKGAVLCIANMTDRKLRGVTLSTSAGDTTTKHEIEANGVLEIGNLELTGDRNFQGGDIFYINAGGFLTVAGFVMDEEGSSQGERGWVKVAKVAATIGLGAAGISLGG
jgi:actin-like ATPase involved in cell morphogenesis